MIKKKRKNIKDRIKESVLVEGEFYIKLAFTIFVVAIYLLIFFLNDGVVYFEPSKYASAFKHEEFQVHIIDVENGDAMLIRLPDGKTMMIDTGEERYYRNVSSYIRQYMYYEKLNEIDYLILTHADSDHIGSAGKIIKDFNVKTVYRPKIYSNYEVENNLNIFAYEVDESDAYRSAIESAYKHGCEILYNEKGIILNFGDCKIEFLSPRLDNYSVDNNYSAVIMITYKGKKFLFTGDIDKTIEKTLIEEYGDYLKSDVLKIAHHGSGSSSSQEFLDIVKPEIAILSSSGHSSILPSYETIDRLKENNIKILATGNIGSFALKVGNEGIEYKEAIKLDNHLVLILSVFIILTFIVWKDPFNIINLSTIKNK